MNAGQVTCPRCRSALPPEAWNEPQLSACARCEAMLQVFAFAALQTPSAATFADAPALEGQASCFYHPLKRAVVACESCGRFICALCDVEVGAEHRCPRCIETGRRKRNSGLLENRSLRYDRVALALAIVPIMFWPVTLFTAPAALFVVVRYWNRCSPVLPVRRTGYVVAALLALAQIVGWLVLFYVAFFMHRA